MNTFFCYPYIHTARQSNEAELFENLITGGYHVYSIDGINICSKIDFIDSVRDVLPFDPPLTNYNLDSFYDSMLEGLYETGLGKIAIIWNFADSLIMRNMQHFLNILLVFYDIAKNLFDPVSDHSIQLVIILLGEGDNYIGFDNG